MNYNQKISTWRYFLYLVYIREWSVLDVKTMQTLYLKSHHKWAYLSPNSRLVQLCRNQWGEVEGATLQSCQNSLVVVMEVVLESQGLNVHQHTKLTNWQKWQRSNHLCDLKCVWRRRGWFPFNKPRQIKLWKYIFSIWNMLKHWPSNNKTNTNASLISKV